MLLISVAKSLFSGDRSKWPVLLFTVAGSLLELAGLALFVPLLLLLLEDDAVSKNEYLSRIYVSLGIGSYGIFLVLVCGAVLFFTVLKNFLLHKINNHRNKTLLKIFSQFSQSLFTSYYKRGLLFIKENSATALSHNTNSVCYSYVFGVLSPAFILAGDILLAALIIASLAFVNIYIAAIEIVLFLPLLLFYQKKIGGKLQRAGKADNEAKRSQWRVTIETFRGYAEVEVNNAFPKLMDFFRSGLKAISDSKIRAESLRSIASKSIEVGVIFVITGVVLTCYFIDNNGGGFRVLIGLFAIATLKLMPAVRSVVSQYSTIKTNLFTLDIIKEADVNQKGGQVQKGDDLNDQKTHDRDLHEPLKFERAIELRGLSFGFGDRGLIIDDLSITIKKGEKLGIKGISGSGKSTLFYLLLGLYKPTTGGVFIDDEELSQQNRGEWHKRVGYVSQDIFIMDTTLAENIVLAENIDYQRLNMAIERSSLKELVESMPMGLHSRIGDGGCRLSGGEKQRVAIARALYKNADVLLLDEPTSSLDNKTETEITQTLENHSFREHNMTIVIISHRGSMLDICDRVIDLS